jgi:hypothetical protein
MKKYTQKSLLFQLVMYTNREAHLPRHIVEIVLNYLRMVFTRFLLFGEEQVYSYDWQHDRISFKLRLPPDICVAPLTTANSLRDGSFLLTTRDKHPETGYNCIFSYVYEPSTNHIKYVSSDSVTQYKTIIRASDNQIYALCKIYDDINNIIEAFIEHLVVDIPYPRWIRGAAIDFYVHNFVPVTLRDDRILLCGGYDRPHELATCSILDLATMTTAPTAPMALARTNFCAVILSSGDVLVTGGLYGHVSGSTDCEIYSVARETWSAAPNMPIGLFAHSMALMPNNTVLVFGGFPMLCSTRNQTVLELDLATFTWREKPCSLDALSIVECASYVQ